MRPPEPDLRSTPAPARTADHSTTGINVDQPPQLSPSAWLRAEDRVAVIAHGKWGIWSAKTGVQVLRFSRARTIAVIDRDRVGQDAARLVDLPEKGPLPIYESLDALLESVQEPPTRIVVGVAPIGDAFPPAVRRDVEAALHHGIPVMSGMHALMNDDPALRRLSMKKRTPLVDLRRPPSDPVLNTGAARSLEIPVVTTIGSDCNSGKMTTSVRLRDAAQAEGIHAAFVATGQTGLLMGPDAGAPVDAVVGDFAAGEVERQLLEAARLDEEGRPTPDSPELIIVEGQGALSHPAYAGVAAAILHGSWPDCLVLCHPQGRREKYFPFQGEVFPVNEPVEEIRLVEAFLRPLWPARVAALALSAPHLEAGEHEAECRRLQEQTGLPVADVVRGSPQRILDGVLDELAKRRSPRTKNLVKIPGRR